MKRPKIEIASLLVPLLLILCWGCAGSGATTAYYTLQPGSSHMAETEARRAGNLVIGIGPVTLPEYLDRDNIVTRVSPNRLRVNDGHRWAGSLQSEISRVLAAHLEAGSRVKEVVIFPWHTRIEPDLRYRLEIHSFEGQPGEKVTLRTAWSLAPASSDQPAVRRVSLIQEEIRGGGIEEMVAAMGRALEELGREMSGAVSKAIP